MASTSFTLDIARRSLLEEGFFDLNDSTVGNRVLEMERRGFPYLTEYGMDFCKQFAFDDVSETTHFYNYHLIISSESDRSSNAPSNGAVSDTGLDTKNSLDMSNASGGVGQKLVAVFSWCICGPKGREWSIMPVHIFTIWRLRGEGGPYMKYPSPSWIM